MFHLHAAFQRGDTFIRLSEFQVRVQGPFQIKLHIPGKIIREQDCVQGGSASGSLEKSSATLEGELLQRSSL